MCKWASLPATLFGSHRLPLWFVVMAVIFLCQTSVFCPQTSYRWCSCICLGPRFLLHISHQRGSTPESWRLKTWASETADRQSLVGSLDSIRTKEPQSSFGCQMLVVLSLPKIPINWFQSNVPGKMNNTNTNIMEPWTSHEPLLHHMVMMLCIIWSCITSLWIIWSCKHRWCQ